MIGMILKEIKGFLVAGMSLPVLAYATGAGIEVIGWLLILYLIAVGFMAYKAIQVNRSREDVEVGDVAAEHLGQEMGLLVQQLEDSSTDMLCHVRNELAQIRSIVSDAISTLQDSFNGFSQESQMQNVYMQEMLESLNQDDAVRGKLEDVSQAAHLINKRVSDAVRALQFEDIVRQLTDSSERHLDYLEGVLGRVNKGLQELSKKELNASAYIAGLQELKIEIDRIEAECKSDAEKSVTQVSMGDGEVVLFD